MKCGRCLLYSHESLRFHKKRGWYYYYISFCEEKKSVLKMARVGGEVMVMVVPL